MEHRCTNCKHWKPLPAEFPCDCRPGEECFCPRKVAPAGDRIGSGHYVPWAPNSGICGRAALPKAEYGKDARSVDPFDDSLMFVQDGSDYRACLVTRGTFGCVLFEDR